MWLLPTTAKKNNSTNGDLTIINVGALVQSDWLIQKCSKVRLVSMDKSNSVAHPTHI